MEQAVSSYDQRFSGTGRLYGEQGINVLQNAQVAIVGIGGVGSWVAEALARTGIGRLIIIDLDDICISNTNRQVHAVEGQIGQLKVDMMKARIEAINPDCQVTAIMDFVTSENMDKLLPDSVDYVVDAIDSIRSKAALINYCVRRKIKIITTGGAGGQIDPSRIVIDDLSRTIQDPLARKLRKLLRKDYGFSTNKKRKFGVRCVFSMEHLRYPKADGSVCHAKPGGDGSTTMDCATGVGAAAMVTGAFGFFAAAEVVNSLTGLKYKDK